MTPSHPFTSFAVLLITLVAAAVAAAAEDPVYNRVSLVESAHAEVANDTLVAELFAQAEDREASAAADQVNRAVDWALALLAQSPQVEVQTLGYNTNPIYNRDTVRGWRVQQSLRLRSSDTRLLSDLVGQLQGQLQMRSIGYEISDQRRREHLDALTKEALERFSTRAERIAETLGRDGYRIVRLDINDGRQAPPPIARGMMMEAATADAAVAPPSFTAGSQRISVTVSGEVELAAP